MKSEIIPASWLKLMSEEDRASFGKAGLTPEEAYEAFADREEKELHKLVYAELTRRGIVAIHSRMDKRATNQVGLPDFCFVIDGTAYAVELKSATGKVRPEQEKMMQRMEANGWHCHVCRSFDELVAILK